MRYLDRSKLLGGSSLTKPIELTKNGFLYRTRALLDSRANAYALIDSGLLKSLSSLLKPLIYPLLRPILIKTFNRTSRSPITYYATLNLSINCRI